jgi:hypothetical protein
MGHQSCSSIISVALLASSIAIAPIQLVSGQVNSDKVANSNSLNLQNIPSKKVQVGDINIAYKVFGKGDPILLISGSSSPMDYWDSTILKDFSLNHTVQCIVALTSL